MNVIFPMYFGGKKRVFQRRVFLIIEEAKILYPSYAYALEWGQQQCPCKFQLLVFLNTPNAGALVATLVWATSKFASFLVISTSTFEHSSADLITA